MSKVEIFFQNGTRSLTEHATLAGANTHAGTEKAALGYAISRILVDGKDF